MVMAVADERVAIRDDATGELGHAIKGHIPPGWKEVHRATEGEAKASHNTVEGKGLVHPSGKPSDRKAPPERVQVVHSAVGGSPVGKPEDRSTGRVGDTKMDGRKT